jgi:hypothetical protein
MSPEQASGAPVDSRTDVFAFGVMLYELLAGERPFAGVSVREVLHATRRASVAPPSQRRPDTPRDLERIVLRCLEKSPDARYRDGVELLDDLDRLARPPPPADVPLPEDGLLRRGLVFTTLHFPVLVRIVALAVLPVMAVVLARHVLFRFVPAAATGATQLLVAGLLGLAALYTVGSALAAITACAARLLADPKRPVRARDAYGALRGKLGTLTGGVLAFGAVIFALVGVGTLAGAALFGQPLSLEIWRVVFGASPGLMLALTIGTSLVVGLATVRWCLAPSVLALERRSTLAALRRSSELVRRAGRPILVTWFAYLLAVQAPIVVMLIIVGAVVHSPVASFEGIIQGDLTTTVGMVASFAAQSVLGLPVGVALALAYLRARQAEGETIEGITAGSTRG